MKVSGPCFSGSAHGRRNRYELALLTVYEPRRMDLRCSRVGGRGGRYKIQKDGLCRVLQ